MVWKCCVPQCKSNWKIPVHRFPIDSSRVEHWLTAICRTELIGASKETLTKLRICTYHFSEDMILPYGPKRRLNDDAVPNLNLPGLNMAQHVDVKVNDNFDEHVKGKNITDNSDFVPLPIKMDEEDTKPERRGLHLLSGESRTQRKMLPNKKRVIYKQRQPINKLRRGNKWNNITKDISNIQNTFIEMLTTNLKCSPEGHRYKKEQKALALTLYKTMRKRAYTYLRQRFKDLKDFKDIPSIQTLQSALHKISISTGLNTFILKYLENIASKMSIKDKVCILMWNEVSIQPKVIYDSQMDIIYGLEDWGNNRSGKKADHVLVFMLRGLHSGWKIPISYSFCYKQTSSTQLIRCIKEHISNINNIGFHIIATVCDQKSSNVNAIKELLLRTDMKRNFERRIRRQTFELGDNEIIPLYDPPHLIKEIRNNLLTKDLALKKENMSEEIASWGIIEAAWIIDGNINKIRPQLKKLNAEHIMEDKINKMCVKHATQVLSGTMASYIETLARLKCTVTANENNFNINMEEGLATAKAVNFFNDLFDSANGSEEEITDENELRRPVTKDSAHHTFWVSAKRILRDMCYIDKITHKIVKKVPSITNWIFTINGFRKIWTFVHLNYDFRKLNTRYCNQDPLKHFFRLIRSHTVCYTNPTPRQFEDSFITLLVSNMKSISKSIISDNCEVTDDNFTLFPSEQCLKDDVSNVEEDNVMCKDSCIDESLELFSNNVVSEESIAVSLSEHPTEIIHLILKRINYCSECNACFKNSEFLVCVKQLVGRINKLLRTRCHSRNLLHVLSQHFEEYNINMSWHKCIEHHVNIFQIMVREIAIRTIVWWCKQKNNINSKKIDLMQCKTKENILQTRRMRALNKSQKYKRLQMLTSC